jgi:hypothetical protein
MQVVLLKQVRTKLIVENQRSPIFLFSIVALVVVKAKLQPSIKTSIEAAQKKRTRHR